MANCPYVTDYLAMIALAQTLGRDASTPPTIYAMIPVPLMQHGAIGANQTVINSVYPTLVPLISAKAGLTTVPINNFAVMGEETNRRISARKYPPALTRAPHTAPLAP